MKTKMWEIKVTYTMSAKTAQEATDLMRGYQFEQMFEAPNVHEFVDIPKELSND